MYISLLRSHILLIWLKLGGNDDDGDEHKEKTSKQKRTWHDTDYAPKSSTCLYLLILFSIRYVLLLILNVCTVYIQLTYSVLVCLYYVLWRTFAVNYLVTRCLVYMEWLYDNK